MTENKIVLLTRAWLKDEKRAEEYNAALTKFFTQIQKKIYKIIVLINIEKDANNHTEKFLSSNFKRIKCIPVNPWGDASGALNIGLNEIFTNNKDYKDIDQILITSKEVDLNEVLPVNSYFLC